MSPNTLIYWVAVVSMMVQAVANTTPLSEELPLTLATQASAEPCLFGEVWSPPAQRCCPYCSRGYGAPPPCVPPKQDTDSPSTSTSVHPANHSSGDPVADDISGCQPCLKGRTFSSERSHDSACKACSTCPKHAYVVTLCNMTHDTVCACKAGVFYLSESTGQCELCDICPVGSVALTACGEGGKGNTVCRQCQNGTFSNVLHATEPCRPCSTCPEGQRLIRPCTSSTDTVCSGKAADMDIPPMYRFDSVNPKHHSRGGDASNANSNNNYHRLSDLDLAGDPLSRASDDQRRQRGPAIREDDSGIDVIPLYCAALGAVVVGLVAYVGFVHYRRMRDKRLTREPHEDVEYSKASAADSGVFADPEMQQQHHLHQHLHLHHHQQQKYHSAVITGSSRLRDLSQSRRKELEKTLQSGARGAGDWKGLARELGYNNGKIASFESKGSKRDPSAPWRQLLQDWSQQEGATVAALLRALRNVGRQDAAKLLQAECSEVLQPLTSALPQHVV